MAKYRNFFTISLALVIFFLLMHPKNAYANYIDWGTGSFLFQILIANILGLLFAIKVYWKKIINFVKKLFSKTKHRTMRNGKNP